MELNKWRTLVSEDAHCQVNHTCKSTKCTRPSFGLIRHYERRRWGQSSVAIWLCNKHLLSDDGIWSPYAPDAPDSVYLYSSASTDLGEITCTYQFRPVCLAEDTDPVTWRWRNFSSRLLEVKPIPSSPWDFVRAFMQGAVRQSNPWMDVSMYEKAVKEHVPILLLCRGIC